MFKKLSCLFLVVILCVSLAVPAYAADNSVLDARIAELEQKYDIRVIYDKDADGSACIGTGAIAMLEMGLEQITPEVAKQVSQYMQGTVGNKLTYNFTYFHNSGIQVSDNVEVLGAFNIKTGVIEVFLPSSSSGTYSSGDNPLTMIHEFGHALHMMVEASYGKAKLESEWAAFNDGRSYKGFLGDGQYADTVFVSEYAAFSFDEDFAETFAHSIIRNRPGLGFSYLLSKDGNKTGLGKKVDFLAELLSQTAQNSDAIVNNIKNNAYNTPVYTSYQGLSLYGIKLQYMGCAYPRFALRGILGGIHEEAKTSEWIYEVGGWYVEAVSGKNYLVFPGGHVRELTEPLQIGTTAPAQVVQEVTQTPQVETTVTPQAEVTETPQTDAAA